MRILFLISSFQAGGAERIGAWLTSFLARSGHEITAATLSARDPFYELDPSIKYLKLGLTKRSPNPLVACKAFYRRVRALRALISQERPDIVLSFMTIPNLLVLVSLWGSKIPVVVAERNYRGAAIVSRFQDTLRSLLYPKATKVVLQTEADLINYPSLSNAIVIPNPVPAIMPEVDSSERERLILAVGRLEKQKGFDILVKAFARCEQRLGWRLVIVGEGSERPRLEALVRERDLQDSVDFIGQRKDIRTLYLKASIFVLSSRYEGFPNVLVEAMSAGCAVIATDCPTGPREIIRNGQDGILVPREDEEALAFALGRLMLEPENRVQLGIAARSVSSRFSEERISGLWLSLLKEAASGS